MRPIAIKIVDATGAIIDVPLTTDLLGWTASYDGKRAFITVARSETTAAPSRWCVA